MINELATRLEPIRQRLRFRNGLRRFFLGPALGAIAAIIVEVLRPARVGGGELDSWSLVAGGAILLGLIVGSAMVLMLNVDFLAAARAVDDACGLKDRITTAVALCDQHAVSPMQELQLRDALAHFPDVHPEVVVPIKSPPRVVPALALLVVASSFILIPMFAEESTPTETLPPPQATVEPPTIDSETAAASDRAIRVYAPYRSNDDFSDSPSLGQGRIARRYFQRQHASTPESP